MLSLLGAIVTVYIVVLAARVGSIDIATFDERHFRAIRPIGGADAFRLLPLDAATLQLHSVALEYLLATVAQLRAILLQTLLNRVVVAQLLPAMSLCVPRARLLLLWGAHMALS